MTHETPLRGKPSASLSLTAHPERKLIRTTGSKRYVDFHIQVKSAPIEAEAADSSRLPLRLALVLDRSGSMQGSKLQTAKSAVLAALDHLSPRDQVSVVVFDDQIDVIQKLTPVTPKLKSQLSKALEGVQARSSTALHEGWLTGCKSITAEVDTGKERSIARCFLLTDGIANVGVTDPEQIAGEAAGIREHTGISTSTFGIGNDYNELLLGPMAVAGGGQFHHLRTPEEITKTFVGEIGGLLAVAARQVALEFEIETAVTATLISPYWEKGASDKTVRRSIAIGDLQGEEERHVVIRFDFPEQSGQEQRTVKARAVWQTEDGQRGTDWQELRFSYASNSACDDEPQNPDVMHWVGLHEIDRARRETIVANNRGDLQAARASIAAAAQHVGGYAGGNAALQEELKDLQSLGSQIAAAPMAPAMAKETYYKQMQRSRNQKDYREEEPSTTPEPPKPEEKKKPEKKWPWR